jgi:hypothetical protein
MQNRGKEVEKEPHSMFVMVELILSASAIEMPPSGPNWLSHSLRNEGVTNKECSECCYRLAVTKMQTSHMR